MNVTELINEIARRTKKTRYQLTRPEVEQAITLMVEILGEEMTKPNGKLSIDNFGILEVQRRVRKNGGMIRSGNSTQTRELTSGVSYRCRFKASRALQKTLRENARQANTSQEKTL